MMSSFSVKMAAGRQLAAENEVADLAIPFSNISKIVRTTHVYACFYIAYVPELVSFSGVPNLNRIRTIEGGKRLRLNCSSQLQVYVLAVAIIL
jgi:hypothetical protein